MGTGPARIVVMSEVIQSFTPLNSAQDTVPYADALAAHAAAGPAHVMVPGHACDPEQGFQDLGRYLGEAMALDLPPMLEGIDLGEGSPLQRAEELAAEAWGAARTWFLTNGASQANRTAALAVRGLGDRVLMQRSAHSSFTDGVLLAGLQPTFVMPSVDHHHGISHGVSPSMLEAELRAAQEAGRSPQSVYVVSPSYFGAVADVAGLAEVAHRYDAAVVVDGAWGAHFGFHPGLPASPVTQGADLVISSTHKLGGSLTQSAMLQLGHGPKATALEPLVERALSMTSSTSASALLRCSLDVARRGLVQGRRRISASLTASDRLRRRLREDGRFGMVSDGFGAFPDIDAVDRLRVPIDVSGTGRTGHWFRSMLMQEHGVCFEMATATTLVAVLGALSQVDVERVADAVIAVADTAAAEGAAGGEHAASGTFPRLPVPGTAAMSPREAYFAGTEVVPAERAVGRVSADTLAAYPPGIPNAVPGEELTQETVGFLQAVAASPSGHVRGAVDDAVSAFRVVRDQA